MIQKYIVTAEGEGRLDIVNRITMLFMQRHLDVESMTFMPSEGLSHHYRLCVLAKEDAIKKVIAQMERIEGLGKVSYE